MRILSRLSNYYSAIKDDYLEHYNFIEEIRKRHDEDEVKILRNILKEGIKQNIFTVSDLNLTAKAVILALKGMEYSWVIKTEFIAKEENLEKLVNVLFNGILKNRTTGKK